MIYFMFMIILFVKMVLNHFHNNVCICAKLMLCACFHLPFSITNDLEVVGHIIFFFFYRHPLLMI